MKKLLVMAAMVLSSVGAFAQHSAGEFTIQPRIGLNVSDVSDFPVYDTKTRAGLNAGVEAEYYAKDWLGISAGIMYSQQGVRLKEDALKGLPKEATLKLDYINIPILANFYVAKGLGLKVGIQPGFKVNDSFNIDGVSVDWNKFADNEAKINSFDLSFPVGISYEYCGFILDARANFSVTNVFKGEGRDYDKSSKNEVLQLTFGYKFSL